MSVTMNYLQQQLFDRIPADSTVLDVGCGGGQWVRHLLDTGHEAFGIDIDLSDELKESIYFFRGDAEKMIFRDEYFDVITMVEVLEHIESPYRALKECLRVLKPKGSLLVSVPNAKSQYRSVNTVKQDVSDGHINCFDIHQMEVLGIILGFEIKSIHFWPDIYPLKYILFECIKK